MLYVFAHVEAIYLLRKIICAVLMNFYVKLIIHQSNYLVKYNYRKLPIISGALTFEISSPMGRLFSGGAYFRGALTIE